jgi:uncharacterized protein YhbP (UPF0306 family)
MPIERSSRRLAPAEIALAARRLLDASALCAIATVVPSGAAHVNTAYFAWSEAFAIVWLSEPDAQHSRNLRANGSAAIAVYDSSQAWGGPDGGIQLFGSARQCGHDDADLAEAVYTSRFPDFARAALGAYRFYALEPRRLKIFDERALGAGTFVAARVAAQGRLEWEATEVYRAEA